MVSLVIISVPGENAVHVVNVKVVTATGQPLHLRLVAIWTHPRTTRNQCVKGGVEGIKHPLRKSVPLGNVTGVRIVQTLPEHPLTIVIVIDLLDSPVHCVNERLLLSLMIIKFCIVCQEGSAVLDELVNWIVRVVHTISGGDLILRIPWNIQIVVISDIFTNYYL